MFKKIHSYIESKVCLLALLGLLSIQSYSQTVSTFAGSGTAGSTDGTGTNALFKSPYGLAIDASGNIYVADSGNSKIRKITPSGEVTTVAGIGANGNLDGDANTASFYSALGLTIDALGNIYVADTYNNRIRKISSTGVVSTIAGSVNGNTDGIGTAASFSTPIGIAVDVSGNLYVADANNNKIRKITPSGEVGTFAGTGAYTSIDGNANAASFKYPTGIVIDASGNLIVTDYYGLKIRKITPEGVVSTIAGGGGMGSEDGTGSSARFAGPEGIAMDASGNFYVSDIGNKKIRKITPEGVVTTVAGSGLTGSADGEASTATFSYPQGVAVDALGNIYIGEQGNNKIRKITMVTTSVDEANVTAFNVYPNPASDKINIVLSENISGLISISDSEGKALLSHAFEGANISLSTASLPNGIYILNLTSGKQSISQKITIHK